MREAVLAFEGGKVTSLFEAEGDSSHHPNDSTRRSAGASVTMNRASASARWAT